MMNRIPYIYILLALLLFGMATTSHAQTIKGKIYGGGEIAQVDGDTKVEVYTGTVGDEEAFDGGVFGGGLGEPTVVTGKVEVLIGKERAGRDAATINGDVYGGSALGNTNCSAELVATDASTTSVTLNAGIINGSMYGGALGQKNGINGATSDIAANVYGPVQVTQNGGNVWNTDNTGNNGSGGIYGCNNLNGEPKNTVKVDIYRTNSHNTNETADDYTDDKYAVFAVYGGGNQASYSTGTPEVTVHGCDNSIEYVYGGGNAAHLTHETDGVGDGNTNVTIWGCDLIGNVFGGGNGQVQAANVSGSTNVAIYGGKILNVYGGSNTNGMIGGSANVYVLAKGEEGGGDACRMDITNVYGGGNRAAGKSGTVTIACTGAGTIENVYGGANMADLTGGITLNITGGQITNVFGGNNNSGRINGAITVNVDWDTEACGTNSLTNVYGGGNLAPYYAYGYDVVDGVWKEKAIDSEKTYGPTVNLKNGTVSGYVYGGGLGEAAVVTGTPTVNLIGATIGTDETIANHTGGNIFGGGDAAPVVGNPQVNANYGSVNDIFAGGRGATAVVTGNPLAYVNQSEDAETHTPLVLTIRDVYGGGDAANVSGTGKVQLDKGTVRDVYGGGNAADVVNTDVIINGGKASMAFAGGHGDKTADPQTEANVSGDAHLTIHGGTVNKAFAGSNSKGTISGEQKVTVEKTGDALAELHVTEVYGGGNQADGKAGTIEIGCTGGNTEGVDDVYGGAREANITTDIALEIKGGNIKRVFGGNNVSGDVAGSIRVDISEDIETYDCGLSLDNVYGAGNQADYTGSPAVNILQGTVKENVFGGGLEATVTGDPTVTVDGGTVTDGVYGGGALADVEGTTNVNITSGTVGNAYGGGLGQLAAAAVGTEGEPGYIPAKKAIEATVNGSANVTVSGGTATNVFGCNNLNGGPNGDVTVTITNGTVTNVYGGGNLAASSVSPVVNINGGTSDKVYGGGYGASAVLTGDPTVNVTDGIVRNDVYGGGALANVVGNTTINVSDNGTVTHDVYGGGALADITGNTTVNLFGGAVGGAYGGGLGSKTGVNGATADVAAIVTGNTTVTLGKLQDDGTYTASQVTETGIFGANNINGTPQGQAFVHVIKTTPRDGQTAGQYDVPAVYGGGNKAAYIPSDETLADVEKNFAKVIIENCDNSIEYVYGGGNAAPVPATQVTIHGANAINHAFAGGNGYGDGNPGADVGYLGYTRDQAHEYGTGQAYIKVDGGTVHNVYGGSNTLGYIRGTTVNVADGDGTCPLLVDNVFGGGNEAPIDGNIEITLECSEGADILYAGANNADVNGNITLNIKSGTYRQVFGGNNMGGAVRGSIEVNVEEGNCTPIIIKELFGCGNRAAYSVYGYIVDGEGHITPRSEQQFALLTDAEKTTEKFVEGKPYDNPTINVFSATAIGTIYGGGLGEEAKIYGNPTVNVDMANGTFANRTLNSTNFPHDIRVIGVDSSGDPKIKSVASLTIPDGIGTIGNIFGGGKKADVHGNTTVNVCVKRPERSALISPFQGAMASIMSFSDADRTANDVPVGNVYGGGKMANVYGNTNVHIRNGNVEGDVFGAGQGDAGQPDAALVQGKTTVIIGE